MRCTSTGRKCDGYNAAEPILRSSSTAALTGKRKESCFITCPSRLQIQNHYLETDSERQSFDFFRSCTSPASSTFFGSDFWNQRVLQLSQSEPAIKYAILALSSLHRRYEKPNFLESGKKCSDALLQYNRAVAHTTKLLSTPGPEAFLKALVACVLFVCYENIMSNYTAARIHLQNGLRILTTSSSPARECNNFLGPIPDDIIQTFSRLDFQAMSFSDSGAPYPYMSSQASRNSPGIVNPVFSNVAEATHALFENIGYVFTVLNDTNDPTFSVEIFHTKIDICRTQLNRWDTAFQTLLLSWPKAPSDALGHSCILLRTYYVIFDIIVSAGVYGQESLYDAHIPSFTHIVSLIEGFPTESSATNIFSFELGTIFPLFFTAIKCRHPVTRRRAIALLNAAKRREGMWESIGAARVAEFVMKLEEKDLGDGEVVTEWKRVHDTHVRVDGRLKKIWLKCVIGKEEGDGWCVREGVVDY